ncbi:hypothetical protein AMELA_G00073120 [Ameiurus melas]|uniref:Uncharacterized protein n=1 Tax=Ameiurus melas TaxID=219545 RepID=A0A7J6AZX1_AMEME|nr:hypothetical protein AMELA_G00073120 [Ameiurus melas]
MRSVTVIAVELLHLNVNDSSLNAVRQRTGRNDNVKPHPSSESLHTHTHTLYTHNTH